MRRHLLCGLVLFVACTGDAPRAADEVDSAAEQWTLPAQPDFSVTEGVDPEFQLFGARSGAMLDDGTIVVGNAGAREVLFFDSSGRLLRRSGGDGEAPGEFRSIFGVYPAADKAVISDISLRRLTMLSPSHDAVDVVDLRPARQAGLPIGFVPGSGVVMAPAPDLGFRPPRGPAPAPASSPRELQLWQMGGDSVALARRLTDAPATTSSFLRWQLPDGPGTTSTDLPAGCVAPPLETVVGSEIYAIDAAGSAVMTWDSNGEAHEVYRAPATAVVTEQVLAQLRQYLEEEHGDRGIPPGTIDEAVQRVGNSLPRWIEVVPDHSGSLWLRLGQCPDDGNAPATFEVIDTTGALRATTTIPSGYRVLAARGTLVLINRRDELDVEHLELYRLRAPSR